METFQSQRNMTEPILSLDKTILTVLIPRANPHMYIDAKAILRFHEENSIQKKQFCRNFMLLGV